MYLRIILPSILLVALVAPCFAKDSHAQHGARASMAATAASGKRARNANPPPSKAGAPIEPEQTVAPPVLPPHGVTQHQFRITNPSPKAVINAPHNQASAMTSTTPAARNAVGQPVIAPKTFVGTQPGVSPAQRTSGVVAPPIVSPGSAHFNLATATNHGRINGATVIRPAIASPAIGGPAQTHYGINGTTVQNRH